MDSKHQKALLTPSPLSSRRASDALAEMRTVVEEWADGEVSSPAMALAEDFIRALPEDLPLPEFSVDPDGAISLDWVEGRDRQFSLSIGPTDRLAYAWLNDTDSGHAVARFNRRVIPSMVLAGIREITGHGATAVRVA